MEGYKKYGKWTINFYNVAEKKAWEQNWQKLQIVNEHFTTQCNLLHIVDLPNFGHNIKYLNF